ncbi:MAG: serine O-acetyltransferase, partial [Mangrovicoccus sp.]
MTQPNTAIRSFDPVWATIVTEAEVALQREPVLGALLHMGVLHHDNLESALACRLAAKLATPEMSQQMVREIADEAFADDLYLGHAARADLSAVLERDPACHRLIEPLLYFKGFQVLQAYRLAHWLWEQGRRDLAYFV